MTENPNLPTETDAQPETVTPQPVSEPAVPPITAPPAADPINYEEKFAQSTREAQVLAGQLEAERAKNARRDLTNEPTDSDLQAAIPGWEYMDEGQKAIARTAKNAERLARDLAADRDERRAAQQWNTDLELAIAQNPSLQGKEQAFKEYANKPSHRGAPMNVLIDAFKGRSATPSPSMNPPEPVTSSGLEQPNGGPRVTEQPKQLTADELKTLRETDERAYNEYTRTHDIDIDKLLAE